ncbi:PAQR family membrane homeostasis protein TrhA [Clostridiisalibacter paucivorans]|uniref:PAQR family membrane homeostasis protein TrhA n=1 Tax=Clostridiisalibacter paucivorans TaxID=408753 RepID=UPI0005584525|nr:hemolysin III family protein [Clostridiisalibacter paucivorans]
MNKFKKIIVRKHFSLGEELAHSISHGIGMLLGITALILFAIKSKKVNNTLYTVSMMIYSISLIILYANSMFYHAFPEGKVKNIFERLDHSSVYLLIAGTYTPLCLIVIGGMKGLVVCSILWGIAIFGVILKAIWIEKFVKIHVLIYLTMGWIIIFFVGTIFKTLTSIGFILLFLGGLFYSIGVLFFVFSWFKYHHFVWHLFVLAGSILLFFSIYIYI